MKLKKGKRSAIHIKFCREGPLQIFPSLILLFQLVCGIQSLEICRIAVSYKVKEHLKTRHVLLNKLRNIPGIQCYICIAIRGRRFSRQRIWFLFFFNSIHVLTTDIIKIIIYYKLTRKTWLAQVLFSATVYWFQVIWNSVTSNLWFQTIENKKEILKRKKLLWIV